MRLGKQISDYLESRPRLALEAGLSSALSIAWLAFFLLPVGVRLFLRPEGCLGLIELILLVSALMPAIIGLLVLSQRSVYICLSTLLRKKNPWPDDNGVLRRLTGESWLFPRSTRSSLGIGQVKVARVLPLGVLTVVTVLVGSVSINGAVAKVSGTSLFSWSVSLSQAQLFYIGLYVVLVMPVLETPLMIGFVEVLTRYGKLRWQLAAMSSGAVWATLHALLNGVATLPSIFWLFWLLSLLYIEIDRRHGLRRAFLAVLAVHSVSNAILFCFTCFAASN